MIHTDHAFLLEISSMF